VVLAMAFMAVSSQALHATSLVVDRGLPDSNLNNAAGGDRSNVAWGFNGDFLSGDDFNLPSTGDPGNPSWQIDTLRVWVVAGAIGDTFSDSFEELALFLGPDGSALPNVKSANMTGNSSDNPDVAVSAVQYPGTSLDYQGSGGDFLNIWQIDFNNVGTFAPGELLFSVGGADSSGLVTPLFMHASNAALSGTTQDGADNFYRWFDATNFDTSIAAGGTIDSNGNGWDKSSDINVQVFATAVPVPGAGVAGLGLVGLIVLKRRRARG